MKTLYTLLPIHDPQRLQPNGCLLKFAKFYGYFILVTSATWLLFYLWRLMWSYDVLQVDDIYYGIMAGLVSLVAIQVMSLAFSVLFIMGVVKQHQSFLFLWIVSAFVLLALDTVVTVYTYALRDHINALWTPWSKLELSVYCLKTVINVPGIAISVVLYREIEMSLRRSEEEREILL